MIDLARRQGDVAEFKLGRRVHFLLSNPDDVYAVLVSREKEFVRAGPARWSLQRGVEIQPFPVFPRTAEEHLAIKRHLQPAFRHERVERARPVLEELAVQTVDGWEAGTVDVSAEMNRFSLAASAAAVFERDIPASLLGAVEQVLSKFAPKVEHPLSTPGLYLHLQGLRAFAEALEAVQAHLSGLLGSGEAGGEGPLDLLAEKAPELAEEERLAVAMILFFASVDPQPTWASWTLHLLSEHPEALERLAGEPTRAESDYAKAVLQESLRLYPPIWRLGKIAATDQVFGGRQVKRGEAVWISPYVIHRDERWYPDATSFKPERWLDAAPLKRCAFIPFATGIHKCPGELFAWAQMTALLSAVASRWRLQPAAEPAPVPEPGSSMRPRGGLRLQLQAR